MSYYKYYLAIQTLLPENYKDDKEFIKNMKTLQELKFDGVELNIKEPEKIKPDELKSFLQDFNLSLSVFATGMTAKSANLSLAATDENRRKESVKRTKGFLEFALNFNAAVVAGFLKGTITEKSPENLEQIKKSVAEIAPEALRLKTTFFIEAINRFESPLGNSLAEVADIIGKSKNPYIKILPDTWHMNIEETGIESALFAYKDDFVSLHLSENNRFFPGFGAIDFKKIIIALDAMKYQGKVAIEGNIKKSFVDDIKYSMEYLTPFLRK